MFIAAFEMHSDFVKDHVEGNIMSDRDFDDIQWAQEAAVKSLMRTILKVIALNAYQDMKVN